MDPRRHAPIATTLAPGARPGWALFDHGVSVVLDQSGGGNTRRPAATVR